MSISIYKRGTDEQQLPLTAENARLAVRSLDGNDTSDMALKYDNHQLIVSCGPDKFAIGYTIDDPEPRSYSFVTDREVRGIETRILGGVWTDLPSFSLVCLEAAERAAVEFAETGRINLTPEWLDNDEVYLLEVANARALGAVDDDADTNPKDEQN